ncbi:uncharacterized protein [Primulina eburnea]|uniref:uncharacterized protein n=1 Tax=Primulina eburnea TaxID=1245227 RepID=UPI003C6C6628
MEEATEIHNRRPLRLCFFSVRFEPPTPPPFHSPRGKQNTTTTATATTVQRTETEEATEIHNRLPMRLCFFSILIGTILLYLCLDQIYCYIFLVFCCIEMDKSWIHSDRRSKQYEEGVELFIRGCLENLHIDPNLIHCPCCKCKNLKKRPAKSIREHLYFHGFIQNYVNWIWHGEFAESDKVNWSSNKEPIGNYHGQFETTNMYEAAYDNYIENPEAFMEFLEEAEKSLYNGCKRYIELSAIVKIYNTKAKHGMSDALFSDLLMDFGDMLQYNHDLPTKMYDVKKTLSCLALSHEKIHACSNDCILYRKQYKDCVNCPKCGLSRWKLTKKNIEKKCVPAKVLWYFPPIPRFKSMFKSLHTSKNLTWHAEATGVPDQLRHPTDSPSWKLVDHMWPDFESEPRNQAQ